MKRTNAFVLKYSPFRESDRIVTFFTEDTGKLSGIARGSLKMTSKITGALEPLTLVELRYVAPYGKDLVVVTGCDPLASLFTSINSLLLSSVANTMVELTLEFNGEHDPNHDFFRLLALCQHRLLLGTDPLLVLRYFELFTLKLAGYLPPAESTRHPLMREMIGYLSRTHLAEARIENPAHLEVLGRYLRRLIRASLERRMRTYDFLQQVTNRTRKQS